MPLRPTKRRAGAQRSELLIFGAILIVGLLLRLAYAVGVSGQDDTSYFAHSLEVLNGTFSTEYEAGGSFPFRFRTGLIYPTALMFRLFGPSEASAAVLPLLVSLATIWLCWQLGRRLSVTTGLVAASLMATFPLSITLATTLAPSPFAGFLTGLSVLLWLMADQDGDRGSEAGGRSGWRWLLFTASGLALGVAYLFRIEAGLLALFFAAYLVWQRRIEPGWLVAGAAALAVVFFENLAYFMAHDEWLYRLKILSGSFAGMETEITTAVEGQRHVGEYFEMMFLRPNDLGLHWAVILPAAALLCFLRSPKRTPFLLWFWPLMLYLMFGSWSLSEYVPTIKTSRYLMMTTVPGAVLVASLLADWIYIKGRMRWLALLVLAGVISGSLVLLNVAYVYRYENAAGSKWAAKAVRQLAESQPETESLPVWSEHHTAFMLKSLLTERDVRALTFHDLSIGRDEVYFQADEIEGLVVVDHFLIDKYVRFSQMDPPGYLLSPPPSWQQLEEVPHPRNGAPYFVLRLLDRLVGGRLSGPAESLRADPVILYRVQPVAETPSSPGV